MIIISMIIFSDVRGQSPADKKESARVFVQKFYDWYTALNPSKLGKENLETATLKRRKDDFDPILSKALWDDYKAAAKVSDEIVGLDFDPFANSQDTRMGFQTGNVKQVGNNFFVNVHDIKSGKPRKQILAAEVAVIAEVKDVGGHWKFVNFIYPQSEGNDNLLNILKTLRKERNKGK